MVLPISAYLNLSSQQVSSLTDCFGFLDQISPKRIFPIQEESYYTTEFSIIQEL